MTGLYRGCMRGRTMYVVPFCMGPLWRGGSSSVWSSPTRSTWSSRCAYDPDGQRGAGQDGDDGFFVKCLHSVGAPLEAGQADVPVAVQRHE